MFNMIDVGGEERRPRSSGNKLDHQTIEAPIQITMNRFGFGPWSESKIKALEKCPLHFYLKYVAKYKPVKAITDTVGKYMTDAGLAAHQILEELLMRPDMTVQQAFTKIHKKYVEGGILPQAEWDSRVGILELNIQTFKDRIEKFLEKNPVKRIYPEIKVGLTKEWEPTGFFADDVFFRGVMDLPIDLENGDFLIFDHKRGGRTDGFRHYKTQLDNYKILCHKGLREARGAQSGIHFIEEGAIKLDAYVTAAEIDATLIPALLRRMDDAVAVVERQGYFACNKKASLCKYCEFAPECKADELNDFVHNSAITKQEGVSVVQVYKRPPDFNLETLPKKLPGLKTPGKLEGLD